MSEQKVIDKGLQELADKVLAALPAELAASTHFKVDAKGEGVLLDFAVKLEKTDFPLVIGIIKKFNGDFVNRKDPVSGKDVGYFIIPKPKPAVPESTPAVSEPPIPQPASAPNDAKPEALIQPSPISFYQEKYCKTCDDKGLCNLSKDGGRMTLCLRVLELQFLDCVSEKLHKIGVAIEANSKALSTFLSKPQPVQSQSSQIKPSAAPPQQPVQPQPQPQGPHVDGGVNWVWDENRNHEKYEKATEKDNARSSAYFALRDRIIAKLNEGKKGLAEYGKWHWISEHGDYIGRKPAKTFPQGGSR